MLFRPRNEEGQGLVEYALILVLVAVVVIVILALLGADHRQHLLKHQQGFDPLVGKPCYGEQPCGLLF